MKAHKLPPAQEHILREQVFDEEHPGSVLHDFQLVLDRVGTGGVPAAGKHNLLPIDLIGELDPKLSRPLRLDMNMKRPLLRSHPYLLGLHLLLRSTGLTRVEGLGAKARLVVDPEVRAVWDGLNNTERYFTLLEAWLLYGRAEMVGEQGRPFEVILDDVLMTWRSTPPKGSDFDLDRPQWVCVGMLSRDFYKAALLDLFGLMRLEYPNKSVRPWCPAGLRHTPFGDALLTLMGEHSVALLDFETEGAADEGEEVPEGEELAEEGGFGAWQPVFQPYFPAWRNNLVLPAPPVREGVFYFRVSLGKVWRLIAIGADSTLDDLVGCVLDGFNFDDDHLYQFSYRDRFGAKVEVWHPSCEEGPYTTEVTIGELPLSPGQTMGLWYDFGDDWKFEVRLERIEEKSRLRKLPQVVEKHGKAPEQYPRWDW
jgi:hypothetical protein